jgi:hypothetical protein
MEQAKKFVERVDAAGDALETWADAKQLRALAALSRDAIAQQAGTREWIGTAGPAKAGWKVAAGITAESVRFVSPAGESVEFARQAKGDGADDESKREAAVYLARSEVSVGEVMAVLRNQAAAAAILPLLWQFDPAADPRESGAEVEAPDNPTLVEDHFDSAEGRGKVRDCQPKGRRGVDLHSGCPFRWDAASASFAQRWAAA